MALAGPGSHDEIPATKRRAQDSWALRAVQQGLVRQVNEVIRRDLINRLISCNSVEDKLFQLVQKTKTHVSQNSSAFVPYPPHGNKKNQAALHFFGTRRHLDPLILCRSRPSCRSPARRSTGNRGACQSSSRPRQCSHRVEHRRVEEPRALRRTPGQAEQASGTGCLPGGRLSRRTSRSASTRRAWGLVDPAGELSFLGPCGSWAGGPTDGCPPPRSRSERRRPRRNTPSDRGTSRAGRGQAAIRGEFEALDPVEIEVRFDRRVEEFRGVWKPPTSGAPGGPFLDFLSHDEADCARRCVLAIVDTRDPGNDRKPGSVE